MYTPTSFAESDRQELFALIEDYSFGMLVVPDAAGDVEISHLPFILDRDARPHGRLLVHVARANRIWRRALERRRALAIFSGPHGYVSPRWYEAPRANVPTWNYAVAHVHGRIEGPMSREDLEALLQRLVDRHERGAMMPWQPADIDPAIREKLIGAIVGFTLVIERIDGKFKLSQNRSPTDQKRVRDALVTRGTPDDIALARLMSRPK